MGKLELSKRAGAGSIADAVVFERYGAGTGTGGGAEEEAGGTFERRRSGERRRVEKLARYVGTGSGSASSGGTKQGSTALQ